MFFCRLFIKYLLGRAIATPQIMQCDKHIQYNIIVISGTKT